MNQFSHDKKTILSSNAIKINPLTIKGNFSTFYMPRLIFSFVFQSESLNPAVLFCPYSAESLAIFKARETPNSVFTRPIVNVAKKCFQRHALIAVCNTFKCREIKTVSLRRVYSGQQFELRADLLDIHKHVQPGKITHLLVKSRKFLAFFAARRKTCKIL